MAARPARSGRRARPTGVGSALFLLVAVLALGSGAPARAQTADPSLSNLEVADNTGDAVALTPTFAPAVRLYIARLAHGVAQITVAPTLSNTGASYEILDNSGNALTDANDVADGFQVALVVGDNTIWVDVTAADGVGYRRYALVASRALARPAVTPTRGSTTSLDVSWSAPGAGTIAGSYDVQYRLGDSGGTVKLTGIHSFSMRNQFEPTRRISDLGGMSISGTSTKSVNSTVPRRGRVTNLGGLVERACTE